MEPSPFVEPKPSLEPEPKKSNFAFYFTGGVVAILCLTCCCGIPLTMYYYVANRVSEDPVVIQRNTEQFVQIDIPDGFEPIVYLDIFILRMSMFSEDDNGETNGQSMIWLMEMGDDLAKDEVAMKQQMEAQMQQNGGKKKAPQIRIDQSGVKNFMIRGQEVEFDYNQCSDRRDNTKYVQAVGVFEGKNSGKKVLINILARKESFSEEEIKKTIESIK